MEYLNNIHNIINISDEKIKLILNKHEYAFNKNENNLRKIFIEYIAYIFEELNKKYKFAYYDRNDSNIYYNDNNDIVVLDFGFSEYKAINYLHDNSGLCKHIDFNNIGGQINCEICHYHEFMHKYANTANIKRRNSI